MGLAMGLGLAEFSGKCYLEDGVEDCEDWKTALS